MEAIGIYPRGSLKMKAIYCSEKLVLLYWIKTRCLNSEYYNITGYVYTSVNQLLLNSSFLECNAVYFGRQLQTFLFP
jgi:hypothetical protein